VDELNRLGREAGSRHVLRALHSPNQLLERMNWFWLNHFSVHQNKSDIRAMVGDYDETIRRHALGRFRDLLGAVATHPAMLRYLDNVRNSAGRNNENYARELMELHTLGVDAGYSQRDVQELARVLTGVGVNFSDSAPRIRRGLNSFYVRRGIFEFNPNRHDFGPKQLLGSAISARGLAELDEALDRLARHPATSQFICAKLARYWMADEPPAELMAAMSDTFRQSDGQIAEVLRTMFDAPTFWRGRKFKDPMNFVLSALRFAFDDRPVQNAPWVLNWLVRLDEPYCGRQTPDGYPLDARAWDSAAQMAARFEFAKGVGAGRVGLFRGDRMEPVEVGIPRLAATRAWREWRAGALSPATRATLAQARSPEEWNAFLLASPEFMQR
jgi:uncharacterized protein (DUF1800 family)